jgi:hypothetical protein
VPQDFGLAAAVLIALAALPGPAARGPVAQRDLPA